MSLTRSVIFLFFTYKFGNRSIQSKIKHNRVKIIIQKLQFVMLCNSKTEATHADMASS